MNSQQSTCIIFCIKWNNIFSTKHKNCNILDGGGGGGGGGSKIT